MAKSVEQDSIMLVMDRSDDNVKLISSTLKKAGYDVVLHSDADEIAHLADHSYPQLAIIDPSTPGLELSELLAALDPGIRVLIVADSGLLDDAPAWAFSKKVRVRLTKPVRRATLLGSVLKVASEPRYLTA